MIMGILILGLLVAQIEATSKFCCQDIAGLNCFNDCCPSQANLLFRTNAPPMSTVCGIRCECRPTAHNISCPPSHPHEIIADTYCCQWGGCDTITSTQNSDVREGEVNEAVED